MVKKVTLASIFIFLFSLPAVLAEEYSVKRSLSSFFNIFTGLFRNGFSSSSVAENIVEAAPLIGLIAVVYGLIYFICVTTLFKNEDHHKYARMIAIGISILGIAQEGIFDSILGLSSTFLILAFILAIVFMFMIFLNHNKKAHFDVAKEMREAQASSLTAKKDLLKIKHDVSLDKKYYDKVKTDLAKLTDDLGNITKLSGSEKHQVNEIARLLQHLSSAKQHGDEGLAHQYAQALGNHIGALISSMKHEDLLDNNLSSVVEKIDLALSHWSHDEMKDAKLEDQVMHLFKQVAKRLGHTFDEKKYQDLLNKNQNLSHHFQNMHSIIRELSTLREHLTKQTESLSDFGYRKKHMEASDLRSAIFEGDLTKAHNHLDNLNALIEQEPNLMRQIGSSTSNMRNLVSQLESHENNVNALLKNLLVGLSASMEGEAKKAKKVETAYVQEAKNAIYILNRLVPFSHQINHFLNGDARAVSFNFSDFMSFFSGFDDVLSSAMNELNSNISNKKSSYDYLNDLVSKLEGLQTSARAVSRGIPDSSMIKSKHDPSRVLARSKSLLSSLSTQLNSAIKSLKTGPIDKLDPEKIKKL